MPCNTYPQLHDRGLDRDPFVADVLMQALREDVGATICALTTGHATDLLASARWRLAVVDVTLGRAGVDIAAAAVEMGTPVVLLTGDFRAADTLRRYGFAVLQKPIAMACPGGGGDGDISKLGCVPLHVHYGGSVHAEGGGVVVVLTVSNTKQEVRPQHLLGSLLSLAGRVGHDPQRSWERTRMCS